LLNLAGGDCVEDIERLEADGGFSAVLRRVERELLTRRKRRGLKDRWRCDRERTLPSPASIVDWLERHHDSEAAAHREAGKAFIPGLTAGLQGLWSVNQVLVAFQQSHPRAAGSDARHGCDAG